jgi:hypothetical protein
MPAALARLRQIRRAKKSGTVANNDGAIACGQRARLAVLVRSDRLGFSRLVRPAPQLRSPNGLAVNILVN